MLAVANYHIWRIVPRIFGSSQALTLRLAQARADSHRSSLTGATGHKPICGGQGCLKASDADTSERRRGVVSCDLVRIDGKVLTRFPEFTAWLAAYRGSGAMMPRRDKPARAI